MSLSQNPNNEPLRISQRNEQEMEQQYCKVGASRPLISGSQSVAGLQVRYRDFLAKAADLSYADAALRDFFARKAAQLKRIIESL